MQFFLIQSTTNTHTLRYIEAAHCLKTSLGHGHVEIYLSNTNNLTVLSGPEGFKKINLPH